MTTLRQLAWSVYGLLAWDKNRNTKMSDKILNVILKAVKANNNNETILDAGCGTGFYASKLSDKFSVTGIDYAPGMIMVARQKYGNERVNYKIGDLSKPLPFESNYFNHAISISSLQEVPDPIFTLNEISRIVKRNGTILLVHFGKPVTHKESINKQVQMQLDSIEKVKFIQKILLYLKSISERNGLSTYWTIDDLKIIVEESGLTIKSIEKFETILIIEIKNSLKHTI